MKTEREIYIHRRNALIPMAEKEANEKVGCPSGPTNTGKQRAKWDCAFYDAMDRLCREWGVVK